MQFILLTGQLLFLLISYLDIPPLPYSKTLSPHYVSIADNTLKLMRYISPSSNLVQKIRESP